MKNKILTIGIVALVILFLSGCGSADAILQGGADGVSTFTTTVPDGREILCIRYAGTNSVSIDCDWSN
jgi:type 1 fimbria pilin